MSEVEAKYGKARWGTLTGYDLEDHDKRLEIFLEIDGRVLYCVAENEEKDALRYIARLLAQHPEGRQVGVYAHEIEGLYKWWFGGPDLSFKVIAVWHVKARKHVFLNPLYGTPWTEWLDMKHVLKKALEKGTDAAKGAVLP